MINLSTEEWDFIERALEICILESMENIKALRNLATSDVSELQNLYKTRISESQRLIIKIRGCLVHDQLLSSSNRGS